MLNNISDETRAPSEPREYPEPYDDGDYAYDLMVEEQLMEEHERICKNEQIHAKGK